MRQINKVIVQDTPPATNVLWLNGNNLKYFTKGVWELIGDRTEPYILPAATVNTLGGVKKASTVTALSEEAELTDVIITLNELLSKLKTAGIMANAAR